MESEAQGIIEQILNDSREKAKSIVEEAHKSVEIMLENQRESAHRKAGEDSSSMLKRAEGEAEIIKETVFTDAKRKAGWMVLSEKNRLVTTVLDEVKTRLKTFPQSENYVSILEKIIVDAGTVLGGGTLEVLLNEHDLTLPLKLSMLAKAIAEKTGTKTQLKLSKQKIEALGGAVVQTPDGRIVVNNTFEATLKRREKELRLKIVRILFRN